MHRPRSPAFHMLHLLLLLYARRAWEASSMLKPTVALLRPQSEPTSEMAPKKKPTLNFRPPTSISLRKVRPNEQEARLFEDVRIREGDTLDTVPDQIRSVLWKRRVKTLELFKKLDVDFTGRISMLEFVRGMRELGLDASAEDLGAVFECFDIERSGLVDYEEFSRLLSHSVTSHPRLVPLSPSAMQIYNLRTEKVDKADANMLSGLELEYGITEWESVPNQIRAALQERHVRVIDLFRQWDADRSGFVTMREFVRAMRNMGLDAPNEVVAALFTSMDENSSGVLEYEELHDMLVRSVQAHPVLEPLELHAMNAIGLRTGKVNREDANILQGFHIDETSLDSVPHQFRMALYTNKVRVIDLFRQMDDDASGLVDLQEFKKAMREFGLRGHEEAVEQVFHTFDADLSGAITYAELDKLCRASVEHFPRLYERRNAMTPQMTDVIVELVRKREAEANRHVAATLAATTRPSTAASTRPQTAPAIRRNRDLWSSVGAKLQAYIVKEKQQRKPVVFTPTQIVTRSGVEIEAFERINVVGNDPRRRGSNKLVIVTHPITGAGGNGDRAPIARLADLPLHRHLEQEGFSVLAYEAHPLAVGGEQTGEAQEEFLLAAMDYVGQHRSFKYCKIALMAQGVGAAAAFLAVSHNPELFEGRVRVISACQPAAIDGPAWEELLSTHVPRCRIPTLISHADVDARHLEKDDHEYKIAQAVHAALDEAVPKEIVEVKGYPLYGKARRFDGSQYFGEHPDSLAFLEEKETEKTGSTRKAPWAHF